MSARVGTYLSDANVARMCADHQPVPMSKVYEMIKTQNAPITRLSQRPATSGIMLRTMSRQYGIPYESLRQQYMDSLGRIKNESVIVTGDYPDVAARRIQPTNSGAASRPQMHRQYAPPLPSGLPVGGGKAPMPPLTVTTHTGSSSALTGQSGSGSGSGSGISGALQRGLAGMQLPSGLHTLPTLGQLAQGVGNPLQQNVLQMLGGFSNPTLPSYLERQGIAPLSGRGGFGSLYKPDQVATYRKLWTQVNNAGIDPAQVNPQLAWGSMAGAASEDQRKSIYRDLVALAAREIPGSIVDPHAQAQPVGAVDPGDLVNI